MELKGEVKCNEKDTGFTFLSLFIYFVRQREREREREREGKQWRVKEKRKGENTKNSLSCQHRAQPGAQSHKP